MNQLLSYLSVIIKTSKVKQKIKKKLMSIYKNYFLQMFVRLPGHEKWNNRDINIFVIRVKGQRNRIIMFLFL